MADFYSDQFAPRGSATAIVHTGTLPNRRFKMPPGISRVPIYSTRGYFDFADSRNPTLAANDLLRILPMKSSDRIYELNLWVSGAGGGGWSGTFTFDLGLYQQGQNHDGEVVTPNMFATGVDVVGGAPHRRTDLLIESTAVKDANRGWQLWEIMAEILTAFQNVTSDPGEEYDLVLEVATGPPINQGAILVEMIFSPAGV